MEMDLALNNLQRLIRRKTQTNQQTNYLPIAGERGALFLKSTPEPVLDFGPGRGPAKGTMADLRPFGS